MLWHSLRPNRIEEAFIEVQKALGQAPQHPEVLMTKADILDAAGYYDLSANYRPKDRVVTFTQVADVFISGHLRAGLALIAARNEAQHMQFPNIPHWKGAEDFGLHLLLTGEQGYGDMIQFLRYVPLARDHVGKISLRAPHRLTRLLHANFPQMPLVTFRRCLARWCRNTSADLCFGRCAFRCFGAVQPDVVAVNAR